jgi:hypothetical protein
MSAEERGAGLALGTIVVSCTAVMAVLLTTRRGFTRFHDVDDLTADVLLGVVLILLLRNSAAGVPGQRLARVGLAASYGLCCFLIVGALLPHLLPTARIPFSALETWAWWMVWAWTLSSVVFYVALSWPKRRKDET